MKPKDVHPYAPNPMTSCWTDTWRTGRQVAHLRPGAGETGEAGLPGPWASPSLASFPTLARALRLCVLWSQVLQSPPVPTLCCRVAASCGLFLTLPAPWRHRLGCERCGALGSVPHLLPPCDHLQGKPDLAGAAEPTQGRCSRARLGGHCGAEVQGPQRPLHPSETAGWR